MISFIVFCGAAILSIILLLVLSIRHSANSVLSWFGSFVLISASVLILNQSKALYELIAYSLFGAGLLFYMIGMFLLVSKLNSQAVSPSHNQQAKTIGDILEVAASRESLIELLNYSLDRFLEIFSLNSGAIHIFHAKKNKLVMGSYRGLIPSHAKKMEILAPGQTAIGRAVQNQRVLIIRDLSVSPDYSFFGGKSEGYTFLAVAPIMVDDKCWGVITFMGRKKYHKGIFTIDQLEQFGHKLGKALVLGRENRRMTAAYNHLNHIIDYYNSLFTFMKDSSSSNNEWNDSDLLGTLKMFKAQLFDSLPFAVIKYSMSTSRCLYYHNSNPAFSSVSARELPPVPINQTPINFVAGEYFIVNGHEITEFVPSNAFNNKQLAAYGYRYDNNYRAIVVIDNISVKDLKRLSESVLIIGNLLSLCYVRQQFDFQFSSNETADDRVTEIDESENDKLKNLSSILTEISGDIQILNEKIRHSEIPDYNDNLKKWLQDIEESSLKGLQMLGISQNINNPNDLIQSVINDSDNEVAFYPGPDMPLIKMNPDQFKEAVNQIIKEAVSEGKRVRLKTTPGENGTISLTVEGEISENFPSTSTLIESRDKNIVLFVRRNKESLEVEEVENILNDTAPSLNIITIEDKPVITDLLDVFLDKLGCENKTLESGEVGLAYIENQLLSGRSIDAVILDINLKDISGLELCRKIKKAGSSIHTILISSWGVDLNKYTLVDAGVDAVLQKPFSLEQLQEVLPKKDLTDAT